MNYWSLSFIVNLGQWPRLSVSAPGPRPVPQLNPAHMLVYETGCIQPCTG